MIAQSPIWQDEPLTVKRGDVWTLGKHRLMCGDSTNAEDVARLMQGEKAQAVITDPPYGEIHSAWDVANTDFIAPLRDAVSENATLVTFCSLPYGFSLHHAMLQSGWVWRWDAVWTKANGGFQVSKYMPRPSHEHLFAYCRKDAPISSLIFNGWDAGESKTRWQKTSEGKGTTYEVYLRPYLAKAQGQEYGQRWVRSVMEGKEKPCMPHKERTKHPTQKPLEIVEKLALLLANNSDLIYDPFLGSGTTLIAAENGNRRCYGLERSEQYCSGIIQRWQVLTGQKAVLNE